MGTYGPVGALGGNTQGHPARRSEGEATLANVLPRLGNQSLSGCQLSLSAIIVNTHWTWPKGFRNGYAQVRTVPFTATCGVSLLLAERCSRWLDEFCRIDGGLPHRGQVR